MKEIKQEHIVKTYDIYYEAADGTRFTSREECKKYEESAKGVLKSKFMKLVVYSGNEEDILGAGSSDSILYGVKLNKEKDKDIVLQLYILDHPYITEEEHKRWLNRAKDLIELAYKEKDILLVEENYEGSLYIFDCCKNIVDRLYNTGSDESK